MHCGKIHTTSSWGTVFFSCCSAALWFGKGGVWFLYVTVISYMLNLCGCISLNAITLNSAGVWRGKKTTAGDLVVTVHIKCF